MRRTIDQPRPLPLSPLPSTRKKRSPRRCALGLGQARAAVLDRQPAACPRAAPRATVTARLRRAVADRVVDQVAHQHRQQRRVARHRAGVGGIELERLPLVRARCGASSATTRARPARPGRAARAAGAAPASSRDSVSSCSTSRVARSQPSSVASQRVAALRVVGLGQRHLGLGADRRDRRAQLVRGVGGEAALGLHQRADALEQAVQRVEHRRHLRRRAVERRPAAAPAAGAPPARCPSRRSGATPRYTAHHTASASSGNATAIGHSVLRSTARRIDGARSDLLADVDLHVALGAVGGEDAPARCRRSRTRAEAAS